MNLATEPMADEGLIRFPDQVAAKGMVAPII
jgi:hypothetical protein